MKHPELGSVELSLPEGQWRKIIFRRWKIIYSIREETIIVGRVWPCALGEIEFNDPVPEE